MEQFAESARRLDGVAQRVPEIERDPASVALLPFVGGDDDDLRPRRPLDHLRDGARFERGLVAARDRLAVGLEEREQPLVAEGRHLHRLAERRPPLPLGQRPEEGDVDDDRRRLMEGADEVLALRQVDPCLAADRRVDLGDERRRDVDERHASEPGRGEEARRVAERSAADRDDRFVAFRPNAGQLSGRLLDDRRGASRPRPPAA